MSIENTHHLSDPVSITLPPVEEPRRLQGMDSVWLSKEAIELFNSVRGLPAAGQRTLKYRDLVEQLDDSKIITVIDARAAVSTVGATETAIVQLVDQQPNGEPGCLLNGIKPNLLYVCPEQAWWYVGIVRNPGLRRWFIFCGLAHDNQRDAGRRVFQL